MKQHYASTEFLAYFTGARRAATAHRRRAWDNAETRSPRFAPIVSTLARLGARYRNWRRRTAAINELCALDDKMLRDIGVERSQIYYIVSGMVKTGDALAPDAGVPAADANKTVLAA